MVKLSVFRWVPPVAQGVVRDLRVRWALEEAGIPYVEHRIGFEDQHTPAYRQLQPFGQVPAVEEGGLRLFESGALVLHFAERSEALLPKEPHARARAQAWVFAALNSVEPAVGALADVDLFSGGEEWARLRRPAAVAFVEERLAAVAGWLGERPYLEGRFTAGDLLMTTVLRGLRHTELVSRFPTLEAYQRRCEARPAFQKALAAQLATFAENAPPQA